MGGKSPNIVFDDADFETAVDNALTAAFTHSGQVCSAGCRAIVQDTIYDRFVEEIGRRADRIRLGHGIDDATEAGALITAEHRAKVEALRRGRHRRGRPARGRWPATRRARAPGRLLLPPDGLRRRHAATMRIVREEVFGPVLTDRAVHDRGRGGRARQRHDLRAGRRGLDRGRRPRPAGRRAAAPRDGLDQRLQHVPAAGRMGRLQAVRASAASSARPASTNTARPSTSGRTRSPGPTGWFGG